MAIQSDLRAPLKEKLVKIMPNVRFLKVRDYDSTTFFKQPDTPEFEPGQAFLHPNGNRYGVRDILLSMKSFPKVLASMTAMEAGAYALDRCLREKWEVTENNLRVVLVQLEMEM